MQQVKTGGQQEMSILDSGNGTVLQSLVLASQTGGEVNQIMTAGEKTVWHYGTKRITDGTMNTVILNCTMFVKSVHKKL